MPPCAGKPGELLPFMKFLTTNLETERLTLRRLQEKDSEALYAIFSDKITMEYWGHLPYKKRQQALDSINEQLEHLDAGRSLCLAIENRSEPGLIGTISLWLFADKFARSHKSLCSA